MFGIAFYELGQAYNKSKAQAEQLKSLEGSIKGSRTKIETMHTDIERVKTLQRNNQKDIQDLEA